MLRFAVRKRLAQLIKKPWASLYHSCEASSSVRESQMTDRQKSQMAAPSTGSSELDSLEKNGSDATEIKDLRPWRPSDSAPPWMGCVLKVKSAVPPTHGLAPAGVPPLTPDGTQSGTITLDSG